MVKSFAWMAPFGLLRNKADYFQKHKASIWRLFSCRKQKNRSGFHLGGFNKLAEWTGLEPATPGVTGRYSNQLNYHSWQEALLAIV